MVWEGTGPFKFFLAEVVRKECPECGWATAVGFENEPGVHGRIPTKCCQCSADDIERALRNEPDIYVHGEPEEAHNHQPEADQAPEVTEIQQEQLELGA